MTEQEVLKLYETRGALLRGHFVLSSGRHADTYLQSALVLTDLAVAERLARALVAKLGSLVENIDLVVAPAIGGLVIGQEVARVLGRPYIFTERKDGEMQLRRGFTVPQGARVLIVEDVITTGLSVRECQAVIEKAGGRVQAIAALVDRNPNAQGRFSVPMVALVALEVPSWPPESCPLCRDAHASAPVKPGSRQ
ncbi:MAG: orotate phosphoribosyltransferase [Zetaproteobacteria bacterium]|nr:MAG: orotate phosphoribosyltransferase [Zetaproteobacteria bacterium]